MYVVGLTGGIGSGKSAVANAFRALGITVVDADQVSREVVEPGEPALDSIREHFGDGVLQADGRLDRAALRQRVFQDAEERKWLEQLLHPLIGMRTFEKLANASSEYAILESPLLIETGQTAITDRVLVVDVPEEVQLARTMQRDSNDEAQVRAIMAAQASRAQRQAQAHDLIDNSAPLSELAPRVAELHQQYLALAAQKRANAS